MMDARIPIFGEISSPAGRLPWAFMRLSAQRNVGWKCRRLLPRKFCRNLWWNRLHRTVKAFVLLTRFPTLSLPDALLEQELVTDPQAVARLDAIRQLDDVAYDTAFEPPVSYYELDGLDLER